MAVKKWQKILLIALAALLCLSIVFTVPKAVTVISTETRKIYNWDSCIYFAVGRSMLNGLKPYKDMFETKPPGIFFLTAASLAYDNDTTILNIACAISLVLIAAVPVIAAALMLYRKKLHPAMKVCALLSAASMFMLIMFYTEEFSGAAQVESFGALFTVLYIAVIIFTDMDKMRWYSPKCFVSAFFLMAAAMFKEPFLFVAIAAAFLFINTRKEFLYRLLLPMLYGGTMGVILMLCTGTLMPYLKYYLPYMVSGHISVYGSPFVRGLNVFELYYDLRMFEIGLAIAVQLPLLAAALLMLLKARQGTAKDILPVIYSAFKIPFAVYLVSFTVGLGGQYFGHHYVFAVPFYIAIILYIVSKLDYADSTKIQKLLCITILISGCVAGVEDAVKFEPDNYLRNSLFIGEEYMKRVNDRLHRDAAYIDGVLNTVGEERYQFLGYNLYVCYGLTEHSPLGPVFFQDPNVLKDEDSWFAKSLKEQLGEANIVLCSPNDFDCGVLQEYTLKLLESEFTEELPDGVQQPPENFEYKLLFRKSCSEFWADAPV